MSIPLDMIADESRSAFKAMDVFEPARRVRVSLLDDGGLQLSGELGPLGTGAWLVWRSIKS